MTNPQRAWIGGLTVILGVATGSAAPIAWAGATPCAMPARPEGLLGAAVRRIVDGDTLIVRLRDGRHEHVRLIGVDTPELHESAKLNREVERTQRDAAHIQALGRRAAEFTAATLPVGHRVELEFDAEHRDREGRLLAYVWRDDGTLVNLALLEAGYASVLTIPPNVRHAERFRACLRAARQAGRGFWAPPIGTSR
jgi:micrococcal nuclease